METIRLATAQDMPELQRIFAYARQAMRDAGNPDQWGDNNPEPETTEADIAREECYVIESDGEVHATFAFVLGDDPTYAQIDGAWLNDKPYGTLHRVASDGRIRGVFEKAVDFGFGKIDVIRVDTHELNAPMRRVIDRAGFTYCGTIICHNGTPRRAYMRDISEENGEQE